MPDDPPDYSAYSLSELYDVRDRIDHARYPDRLRQIEEEITRKEALQQLEDEKIAGQARSQADTTAPPYRGPAWYVTLGTLGIIFGLIGLYHEAQRAMQPFTYQLMEEAFEQMVPAVEAKRPTGGEADTFWRVWDATKNTMNAPSWYTPYLIVTGILGLGCMAIYITGGIRLLLRHRVGVKLLALGCAVSILLRSAHVLTSFLTFAFPLVVLLPSFVGGVVIDGVLLVALFAMRHAVEELR